VADRLRWGILSTGNIARQFATGVASSRRGTLAAVGSRTAASAQTFAKSFKIPSAHGVYDAVISDPTVDAVYNALPNSMHHAWTIAALKAGKHVLCEKPLASNIAQAKEMFDVAAQTGRLLVEAFMYRSHPQTLAVLDAVASGVVGRVKLVRTSFCFRTNRPDNNIRFSRELAGGALMDIGCYCVNLSRAVAGAEPASMTATGVLHSSGVDEIAAGTLSFANGIIASFTCGMTLHADNAAYICGDAGYIEIPVPWKPPVGEARFTIARSTPPRMDSAGKLIPVAPPRETIRLESSDDLYAIEADDFAAAIAGDRPARITAADSIGNMAVLDELRRQVGVIAP
jgi:predicted dehydrogenase